MARLRRFREYMARMNPVADPALAIRDGLHVDRPGSSVAEQLAARLELEPASTHLVLGGTGSGKTSELLRAVTLLRERLSEAGDLIEYIDVSRLHDLAASRFSGVLVDSAGLALAAGVEQRGLAEATPAQQLAVKALRKHAHGEGAWLSPEDDEWEDYNEARQPDMVYRRGQGTLIPAEQPIPEDLESLIPHLRLLRASYPGESAHAIFLFDSLDRLGDPARFREAVEHDLRVLKTVGIGVVVVGPIRFITAGDRKVTDLFDQTHFQLPVDPGEAAGLAFLTTVLRRRAGPELLPDECLEPLALASGGVLRDLISLAKSAGQEAYAAGHEPIALADVARAVDAFGRNLAVGLDFTHIKLLKHLRQGAGFVIRGERETSLLETRRVLLYESGWVVHPALAPLLDAVPEAA